MGKRKVKINENFPNRPTEKTAGREFKNPVNLNMQQTCDHAGIKNSTNVILL